MKTYLFVFLAVLLSKIASAQCSSHPVTLTHQADAAFPLPDECMSALHDQAGRPYLYVAGKERGLLIYDVSTIATPLLIDSIKVTSLDTMELMSLWQDGNYLYLALGNVFVNSSQPGVAIVDVTDPTSPVLKSVWKYPTQSGGAGVVRVDGNYAYLGGMRRGLMILDITDKTNPSLVSVFKPSILYPNPTSPDSLKYNARGMAVKNSVVYLCDDAGGVRIINATDKALPVETGHYSNPAIFSRPRAYNNLILDDTLLYVAVDYCGMEILSVADTANITQVGWWNPWHCESPANTWFNSRGHTNEIQFDPVCRDIFLASGKSEVEVVNVANPAAPDSCTKYTTTGGNVGVWGIALYLDQLYACYIYVPTGIPFFSNWSGVKALTWNSCGTNEVRSNAASAEFEIFPNPSSGQFEIRFPANPINKSTVVVYDIYGREVYKQCLSAGTKNASINLAGLTPGVYVAEFCQPDFTGKKLIVIR